jgi:hypothetical protein
MTPPNVIYLQVCGECHDNECDKCDFNKLSEVTWCKDRINDNDVAYFSEEHVRITVFAYLQGLSEFLKSTYGVNISAGTITDNIMRNLKGDKNA